MNLREVVKERRGVLGISQIDLAEMAGISLATQPLDENCNTNLRGAGTGNGVPYQNVSLSHKSRMKLASILPWREKVG